MSEKKKLSSGDVARLLEDPSVDHRAEAAAKVSAEFASGDLSDSERTIAEDIFRAMVKDVEVRVRKALADSLASNPDVPHDVALTLAGDVAEVALPMIENSIVLTDEDLVEIVQTKGMDEQMAVANRSHVGEIVADALVETKVEDVVAVLVANDGAVLSENTMGKVLDDFGDSEKVNAPMARRKTLPIGVAERLVSLVSDRLKDHMVSHHEFSPDMAADLLLDCRERATISLLEPGADSPDVLALVEQLHKNGRLTSTIIMRALCVGDTTFFEAALAMRANVPVANAYKLVYDKGNLGLEQLFEKADIPPSMLFMTRTALEVAAEMTVTSGDDREHFKQVMIERVLTTCEDDFDSDNLDYFIGKLASDNTKEQAKAS